MPAAAKPCCRALPQFRLWPLIDLDRADLIIGIAAIAAPDPLFGLLHQALLDWVVMHLAQLLHAIALAPRMKVVKSFLPDIMVWRLGPERGLPLGYAACDSECGERTVV